MSATHVVVVTFGVVPNQIFAYSDREGAWVLARDARKQGFKDARVATIEQHQAAMSKRSIVTGSRKNG